MQKICDRIEDANSFFFNFTYEKLIRFTLYYCTAKNTVSVSIKHSNLNNLNIIK